ncbi:MAG TPA: methyl-accepting chemotaxis protein, partial [Longimicrobium sp.]|nr:methyl-accepting chemotaxis protein [Longimicrobium sp.]
MNGISTDFEALFARERWLVLRERHRQATRMRWLLIALAVGLGFTGRLTGALDITWTAATVLAGITFVANAAVVLLLRADRFSPWQFWAIQAVDTAVIAGFAYALGERGYLVLPYLIFAIGGYALGMPRAAQAQLALAAVFYPLGRAAGMGIETPAEGWVLAIEWLFLIGTGWLARSGPVAYTRRLRRVRQALARAQGGDFTTVLPGRALDDIGFLSVSVNAMSRTVGAMVREIQRGAQSLAATSERLASSAAEVEGAARTIGATTEEGAGEARAQLGLVAQGADRVEAAGRESDAVRGEAVRSAET